MNIVLSVDLNKKSKDRDASLEIIVHANEKFELDGDTSYSQDTISISETLELDTRIEKSMSKNLEISGGDTA